MKEQYRKIVEAAKEFGASDLTQDLVAIIDRLDKQLTEIVEAGEFLDRYIRLANKYDVADDDCWLINSYGDGGYYKIKVGQIRRLAKALEEVKDE